MTKQKGRWYFTKSSVDAHRLLSNSISLCGYVVAPSKEWKQWSKRKEATIPRCPDCLAMLPGEGDPPEGE